EKMLEVRDVRAGMMLADRHEWLSGFAGELGLALAVESLLGLTVPERATWVRTVLAELTRIAHHLAFLAAFPYPPLQGAPLAGRDALARDEHVLVAGLRLREHVLDLLEQATGARIHPMYARVGGVHEDLPAGWTQRARTAGRRIGAGIEAFVELLAAEHVASALRGSGVLDLAAARRWGVTGPVARAAGLDLDLRRDDPVVAYPELAGVLHVPVHAEGDTLARMSCLLEEITVSLALVDACLDRLQEVGGPVDVRLPKVVRLPEGHVATWTENPGGVAGYLVVSHGEPTPWRVKIAAPSYASAQALGPLLIGTPIDHLATTVASMLLMVGDIDR
ncbi:MAG: NADH-quinone oxidoreductase subunit D-related protein, partial [Actinomycetes bacterium]